MSWITRGAEASGFLLSGPGGQSSAVPAVATHRGSLWCLWSDAKGGLYYAIGNNDVFQTRIGFPDAGIPVMAEVLGALHALIVHDNGEMVHYLYDDVNAVWAAPTPLDLNCGFVAHSTPAFKAFHNKLFLVFLKDLTLHYSFWSIPDSCWTLPRKLSDETFSGIPALFILEGNLHVLCAATSGNRDILGFVYSVPDDFWTSCNDVSEGKAAVGVSATSFGDSAFLAFQENGADDVSHSIFVAEYTNGSWKPQKAVATQTSADPPQLAVLNGRINCIFNSNDDKKDLMWYSRPLLDYSLSSWMGEIPDDTFLSNMTIPGTHDSCAESNIPIVRTQYLSVTKQLEAGLRFLDLRLRVHDDGELHCYHGGIAINWPRGLKFVTVMDEVFSFMISENQTPTETVLVSINNDDVSGKLPPQIFYNAVKKHIESRPAWSNGSQKWDTSRTTITLGQARGKAVLLRRFQPDPAISYGDRIGIDLSGWLNNNPDFTLVTPESLSITLQDKWQYLDPLPLASLVQSKFNFISSMLEKAAAGRPDEWFINFCSAVGVPSMKGEVAESHWIAVGAHR